MMNNMQKELERVQKELREPWVKIIRETEKTIESKVSTIDKIDKSLLSSTKLTKKELDTVLGAVFNTEGITYEYVKTLITNYEKATSNVFMNNHGIITIEMNNINLNREEYVDLLLKYIINICDDDLKNKGLLRYILKNSKHISTEEKAIKVFTYLLKEMKESPIFGGCLTLMDERDIRLINKYGIKERRLLTDEVLETVKNL